MTVPMHSFRHLLHSTLSLILLVAFAGIAGCANDNSSGGMSSPPDWVVVPSGGQHAKSATRDYIANGGSIPCTECHGADLSGGSSKVSCFGNPAGCHHGPVSGWIATSPAVQNHGVCREAGPRQLRLRLLPDLPREQTSPAAGRRCRASSPATG